MADKEKETGLSVLFKSLASGVTGLQKGIEQKRQNDLQEFSMRLQLQRAQQAEQAFLMSQEAHQQNMKLNDLRISDLERQKLELADPIGTAKKNAEAQAVAQGIADRYQLDSLIGQNLPEFPGPFSPSEMENIARQNAINKFPADATLEFNRFGFPVGAKTATNRGQTFDQMYANKYGVDALAEFKQKGKVQGKTLNAENQFIYDYLKENRPETADEEFFNLLSRPKSASQKAAFDRITNKLLGSGLTDIFQADDPEDIITVVNIAQALSSLDPQYIDGDNLDSLLQSILGEEEIGNQ